MKRSEFIKLWNECETAVEVASVLGREASSVSAWASRLRRQGHNLKAMRRGRPPLKEADGAWGYGSRTEEFIWAWQMSESPAEAAERHGVGEHSARQMAHALRRRGVPLKTFINHKSPDVEHAHPELIELAEQALKAYEEEKGAA